MKKKKKQPCSYAPQVEPCNTCAPINTCEPCKTIKSHDSCKSCEAVEECSPILSCKPCSTHKKTMDCYVECPCDNYEITCVDKCVELAKKAEALFEKACKYEAEATNTFNQAKECEKSAKLLSQKACSLLQNANKCEDQSKANECKAKQLMQQAEELSQKAKCLSKEADNIEKEAKANCEKAKCLYEKAETCNEKAKALYNQALKFDEKALECYKTAGDKIKEYEKNSKKCEEMINKCDNKLKKCESNCVSKETVMPDMGMTGCGCNKESAMNTCDKIVQKSFSCDDEIIYIDATDVCSLGNECSSYVTPMYNMAPMQCMGNFTNKYPSLDQTMTPYETENDDMWTNYYMYMQQMMKQMPYNRN